VDTESEDFKEMLKILNYVTKTRYEAFQEKKEQFRQLQGTLAGLSDDEQRALIHLIKNRKSDSEAQSAMDLLVDEEAIIKLAKLSEEEQFNMKNRYLHQQKTMKYAEKKRMPVDERTVRDMLRNQHLFRTKINKEVSNYTDAMENSQFEHGLLTYLREGAYGELGDLVKEVGIKRDTIPFLNLTQFRQYKDNMIHESDHQFQYLMTALFTPLDMTDHETNFVGWNELPGMVPMDRPNWLTAIIPEPHPQTDALMSIEVLENAPRFATN
jgi:hypothetical protein